MMNDVKVKGNGMTTYSLVEIERLVGREKRILSEREEGEGEGEKDCLGIGVT